MDRRAFFKIPAAVATAVAIPAIAATPAKARRQFVAMSSDGITWTTNGLIPTEWTSMVWDGSVWVAIGQ